MELISAAEVARRAGCSSVSVLDYMHRKRIPVVESSNRRYKFDAAIVETVSELVEAGRERKRNGSKRDTAADNAKWDKDICDHNCALCFAMRQEAYPSIRSSWPSNEQDEQRIEAFPYNRGADRASEMVFNVRGGAR